MHTPHTHILTYTVMVEVEVDNPKCVTAEQIELRLGDGVQWMDGVVKVRVSPVAYSLALSAGSDSEDTGD